MFKIAVGLNQGSLKLCEVSKTLRSRVRKEERKQSEIES